MNHNFTDYIIFSTKRNIDIFLHILILGISVNLAPKIIEGPNWTILFFLAQLNH